ncbi:MAG: hypothetical protein HPY45_13185 [Anaerolineae bacterium]|nr:hypothetical protein [Anaerolineae bacterium]
MYSVAFIPHKSQYTQIFIPHNAWNFFLLNDIQLPKQQSAEREENLLLKLSESSFSFWDNAEDAVYDRL